MLGAEMERGTKSLGNFLGLAGAVLPRAGKVFSEMSFRILPRPCLGEFTVLALHPPTGSLQNVKLNSPLPESGKGMFQLDI